MFRRLFTLAAAASLLVFLAVVALWVLSYARPRQFIRGTGPDAIVAYSGAGTLTVARSIRPGMISRGV
jgi:hypothetical protein